ncbi:MAG TPA: endonuclease/exonuclease/phosphatase family protein [Planktothrix sp.]
MAYAKTKNIEAALLTAILLVGALSLASEVPGVWFCDLLSQLRFVMLALSIIGLLACVLTRYWYAALLSALIVIGNMAPLIFKLLPMQCDGSSLTTSLSVLEYNTEFQNNDDYASFLNLISKDSPDIIALVEVDKKWIDALSPVYEKYPYRLFDSAGAGMALFSRFQISKSEVRYFGKSHHPRIEAHLLVNGTELSLMEVHPPTPSSDQRFHERNDEMVQMAQEMQELPSPKILIGDLNCGPWSNSFEQLWKVSKLRDSSYGFGTLPTWPARAGRIIPGVPIPPLIPIDHILVSHDICVDKRAVGPAINSDHLPVFVQLSLHK